MKPEVRGILLDIGWIGLWFALLILAGFGLRDPWPADEPRFAAVALEMLRSGNWIIPHVGGDLYQDKPPLHFWLMATGILATGSTQVGFLLPSMLSSLGTLLLVYDLVRRLHGREAARFSAITLACCIHFIKTTRGAQIDATLIFFCTLGLYGILRHLLLKDSVGYAALGAGAAGLGVVAKAVGFLALALLPITALLARRFGIARVGARTWIIVGVVFAATIALWLVPMLVHVAGSGSPALAAYRDELLFQQTVTRYTQAWHHIRPWYYFLVEVIPVLWLPLSALLPWLILRWRDDWRQRRAATWVPLLWAVLVVAFFSLSTGKRGVYVLPALPALAIAAAPHLPALFAARAVQRLSLVLAGVLVVPGVLVSLGLLFDVSRVEELIGGSELASAGPVFVFAALATLAWIAAWRLRPLLAWPAVVASLTLVWGFGVAPQINGERSASTFVGQMLAQVPTGSTLGLVAYKEQFLLYLDRDTVNFGHARWREGDAEAIDAARWLSGGSDRVLLVPGHQIERCFATTERRYAGESSDDRWYLVSGTPARECVERGDPRRVIHFPAPSSTGR